MGGRRGGVRAWRVGEEEEMEKRVFFFFFYFFGFQWGGGKWQGGEENKRLPSRASHIMDHPFCFTFLLRQPCRLLA